MLFTYTPLARCASPSDRGGVTQRAKEMVSHKLVEELMLNDHYNEATVNQSPTHTFCRRRGDGHVMSCEGTSVM